jgi:hypothetical protein
MVKTLHAVSLLGQSLGGRRVVKVALLALYYALIVAGLLAIYGPGDFSTPPFVYQGF